MHIAHTEIFRIKGFDPVMLGQYNVCRFLILRVSPIHAGEYDKDLDYDKD